MKIGQFTLNFFIIFLALTACSAETPLPVTVTVTPTATVEAVSSLVTVTPSEVAVTAVPPTFTPTFMPSSTNTATSRPTITPMPTSTAIPIVRLKDTAPISVNVRSGPGTAYPILRQLGSGQEAVVIGRNKESSWWQIKFGNDDAIGWLLGDLVILLGDEQAIPVSEAPPLPPTAVPTPTATAESKQSAKKSEQESSSPDELVAKLRCGKDFCVTYQAMVSMAENGGCIGNHSIYITVLHGLPPGQPMDGVVLGDTFNNIEVASGDKGPGRTEITLWGNSMTLYVKRNIDGTPYTSEESFNFTAKDELIPAELLAANGYCEGKIDKCEWARNNNQVCRGHYSWRVTFHNF